MLLSPLHIPRASDEHPTSIHKNTNGIDLREGQRTPVRIGDGSGSGLRALFSIEGLGLRRISVEARFNMSEILRYEAPTCHEVSLVMSGSDQ